MSTISQIAILMTISANSNLSSFISKLIKDHQGTWEQEYDSGVFINTISAIKCAHQILELHKEVRIDISIVELDFNNDVPQFSVPG